MYDVVIIGGGPAAAGAAFYASEKRLHALMVYEELGGKVGQRESLISYDQGAQGSSTRRYVKRDDREVAELIPALPANAAVRLLISHIMHHGSVRRDQVTHIKRSGTYWSIETGNNGLLPARTVIMATGTVPRRLELPGADRLVDPGMDYSIATYAQHMQGQPVAVIGWTVRALLGAAELAQVATHVFVIIPDPHFVPTPLSEKLGRQDNITLLAGYEITQLIGNRTIEAIEVRAGSDSRCINVQRAFVDLGLQPNSQLVQPLGCTNPDGFIVVDQHMATNIPGLFAAGDVTTAAGEQVLIAIGDGARAAKSAHQFILQGAMDEQQLQERSVSR